MEALLQFPAEHEAPALKPFKFGPITIPVSYAPQSKNGKMYPGYRFVITLGQKEHDIRRSTLEKLREYARLIVEEYNKGSYSTGDEVLTLTGDKLERYREYQDIEEQLGRSAINLLRDEVLPALQLLAGFKISLPEVARDYADRHTVRRQITLRAAVMLFLKVKAGGGVKKAISTNQQDRYRGILNYLSDKYGHRPMSGVKPVHVRAFLRGLSRQKKIRARQRAAEKERNKKGQVI